MRYFQPVIRYEMTATTQETFKHLTVLNLQTIECLYVVSEQSMFRSVEVDAAVSQKSSLATLLLA
jgi:hypothetical protein